MPTIPIAIIIPEYNKPDVGIPAGTKPWINGNMPPKIVSNAIAIVTNFSVPNSMLFITPYISPIIPTAIIINW